MLKIATYGVDKVQQLTRVLERDLAAYGYAFMESQLHQAMVQHEG